jgi:hypothetical protein
MVSMTSDEREQMQPDASESYGRRIAFLCILCGIPIFLIVAQFAGPGRAAEAGLCASVDAYVLKLRWESRPKLGFWCAVSLILLLQIVAIFLLPFGDQSTPGFALLPAALLIYLVDECIVYLFTQGIVRSPKQV